MLIFRPKSKFLISHFEKKFRIRFEKYLNLEHLVLLNIKARKSIMLQSSAASKILTIVFQTILLTLLINFSYSFAQDSKPVSHAFHDSFVFGVDGGVTIAQTDYEKSKVGYSLRAVTEYFFKTNSIHLLGLKLKLGSEELSGEDSRATISGQEIPPVFKTSVFSVGLALTYSVSVADVFFPYVSAGFTNMWFDPKDDAGRPGIGNASDLYSKSAYAYSIELGFKVRVSDRFSINLSGNPYLPQTDYLDDVAGATQNDAYTSVLLGFSYSPFGDADSDGDGLIGSDDYCPDEPEDFDGFEDEDGCPDLDNDMDGVMDVNDKCPDEPEDVDGFQDEDGCPDYDNDLDGILDVHDKCPNEAEDFDGFEDEDGCPDLDNDGDGIADVLDKCPNDAEDFNGIEDEDGCPEGTDLSTTNKFTLNADDIFLPNSYKIKLEGKESLDEVMAAIQKSPIQKWRIEGHMDSRGDARNLRTLSLERAKAILEYFTYFGNLKRENFQVFGMGDKSPVADNRTEEGRRQNRRIEIIGVE